MRSLKRQSTGQQGLSFFNSVRRGGPAGQQALSFADLCRRGGPGGQENLSTFSGPRWGGRRPRGDPGGQQDLSTLSGPRRSGRRRPGAPTAVSTVGEAVFRRIRRCGLCIKGPAAGGVRRGTPNQDDGAAHRRLLSPPGCRKARSSEGGISSAGERQDSPQVGQPLVVATPHGAEGGRFVAALLRFPPPQPGHHCRLLPTAQHVGFCEQGGWVHYFFENRFKKRISSNSSAPSQHTENGNHDDVRRF